MIENTLNNELFKVLVVSTMSSGKSTCINAIIGEDILLSKNQACISKPTYIINDDNSKNFKAYVRYNDDTKRVFCINNIYDMEYFEQDKSIVHVIILT
ncbi:dynamin family protein [Romboutsia ilealis]|uniref:dynamin family protein n=1 Tax=Romboutsia ilealis TaxID=1115758 RepID=UPI002676C547|nr:dynamin family protein [Romboutsia ilealis]